MDVSGGETPTVLAVSSVGVIPLRLPYLSAVGSPFVPLLADGACWEFAPIQCCRALDDGAITTLDDKVFSSDLEREED